MLALSSLAQAQTGTGAPGLQSPQREAAEQELMRQQERERSIRQQQEAVPDVRLPATTVATPSTRLPSGEAPCFVIDTLELSGERSAQFQWALAAARRADDGQADPFAGRCLGTGGINLLMARVQNAIMQKGYVTTRVLAEPQNLATGTLKLMLVPGYIRAIHFAPGANPRATWWNAVPARPGDLLNVRDTEQALENFKRVPTAEADIQIMPAEGGNAKPGESDLQIQWKQGLPFRLALGLDDGGSRSTGKLQGSVTLSYDHWLTLNDLFYLSLNQNVDGNRHGPRGTGGMVAHYSIPYAYWLLAFTASDSRYHQSVAGISQDYNYSGASQNREVKLSRLVYRDASRKTTVSLRGWQRSAQNFIDDTEVEVQRRRMAGWEVGIGHREFLGQATLDLNLQYRRGTGAMDAIAAPEEAFGEGTSRFKLILADAALSVPFTLAGQPLRYSGSWRTQHNRTPLVPQDRFAIGGRYTVRGYDGESSLSAERGWLLRNELAMPLGSSGQEAYAGLDHGEVAGPSAEWLIARRLTGGFVGVRGQWLGVQYDAFVGWPVRKPELFRTASHTAGFNLNTSF
ncbi:ShlB/FhaC/HecB family hemolysin secretion/activation protein [Janthinobacterium sp. NFX145]|uniref:ShlB/FhaC/HecB family hemolysin secretion/activation protein n=1 Tax=Janthinobacterium sp. NFX145 TaxID=3415602 RepID=UPI003CC6D309